VDNVEVDRGGRRRKVRSDVYGAAGRVRKADLGSGSGSAKQYRIVYRRENLLSRKFAFVLCVVVGLLDGFLVARRRRSTTAKSGHVLLFFVRRFEDLKWVVRAMQAVAVRGAIYLERAEQALVHAHHGPRVVELSTVVGRAEKRNKLSFREELVAVFHDLVSSADEIHIVLLQEA
jgi:hypothetical protein